MRRKLQFLIISMITVMMVNASAFGESLFSLGVSQNAAPMVPRSLYSSVKAKAIGDLVTITINEASVSSDNISLSINKSSTTVDNFRDMVNKVLPGKWVPEGLDDYGGEHALGSTANSQRAVKMSDTITTQVVQVLPNGNLIVQGKKVSVNGGEKVNVVISGIVDPRFIDNAGKIDSGKVANLQIAMSGKGSISTSGSDNPINRFIRYLF